MEREKEGDEEKFFRFLLGRMEFFLFLFFRSAERKEEDSFRKKNLKI